MKADKDPEPNAQHESMGGSRADSLTLGPMLKLSPYSKQVK